MNTRTLASTLALISTLTGCGTLFSARATATPHGASARVDADGRAVAAAGALVGIANALASSGSADSQGGVTADVHAQTVGVATDRGASTVGAGGTSTTTGLTSSTNTPTSITTATNTSGAGSTGVGGIARSTGATGAGASAGATIQMGRVGLVTIERMTTVGADDDVIAGGAVTLDGAPMVAGGLVIVDGAIELATAGGAATATRTTTTTTTTRLTTARTSGRTGVRVHAQGEGSAQWRVGGGVLVVADRGGHRWRLRVQGGDLAVHTEGANPEGRAVWVPTGGAMRVEVTAMGDGRLALEGDAPSVSVDSGANVVLSAQTMGALDELIRSAPAGSDDALRMAAAVQVTLREAERAEPSFYNVPIRGRSIVLVVDVSYSMREADPRAVDLSIAPGLTPTKLDVARAELVKVLGSLPADVSVNVVAFSSNVARLWQNPRVMDQASLSEAIRWIGALQPRDETEPVAALEVAASMQPEQIVLLSDGRPTDRDTIARALLGLADGVSTRMRLDVVGIGPDQDRTFLAALAARGHGELRLR
jgi:hypothetical protein